MSRGCQQCGCVEIDEDAARGDAVCTQCGCVLEENVIVSELQFQETGVGGHSLIGQYVSADGIGSGKLGIAGLRGISSKESREVTLQNGKRKIDEVASQLRLNQHCVDTAFNFFKMAVARGLTRGRRSTHVVAACLYITCRIEGTPHLLLDFSDVLQVNVYELGKVFSFIARSLYLQLPPTDPCIYVLRFAHALKFGAKEHDVAMLALRLVQRMKRDWLAVGRRPTGLCGAALLMAARYYNFNRSLQEIVRVAQIGESVVKKRLLEFAETPSSALTLDEFQSVDLEEEQDPPAFREARKKAKQPELSKFDAVLLETEKQVEAALSEQRRQRFSRGPWAKITRESESLESENLFGLSQSAVEELQQCNQFIEEEILNDVLAGAVNDENTQGVNDESDSHLTEIVPTFADKYRSLRPTLESLGIRENLSGISTSLDHDGNGQNSENETGEIDLEGISDAELDEYILTPSEVQMKAKIWMAANGQFLKEQDEKRKRKAEEEKNKPEKKRRNRVKRKPIQATTAGEAIEKIVQEKRLSSKINYEMLKNLTASVSSAVTAGTNCNATQLSNIGHTSGTSVSDNEPVDANRHNMSNTEQLLPNEQAACADSNEVMFSADSSDVETGPEDGPVSAVDLMRRHIDNVYGTQS